jgi:o-succinylbenzoate---CoA ligase
MSMPDNILLPDWLRRCAENRPQHLAAQCGQLRWSFAELDRRATQLARQLATLGAGEGERVALLAANGLSYIALVHALTRLGAILVPLNIRLTPLELSWQLRDVRASLLVCDAGYSRQAHEIAGALPRLRLATLAEHAQGNATPLCAQPENEVSLRPLIDLSSTQAIMYTSGTTGQPKGAIITYGMQWWNALGSALNLGHNPEDRWLACLPLFHIGGLSILMRSVINGTSVMLHKKFDPSAVNHALVRDEISIISLVSVMLQRMLAALDSDGYPATLRCILLGGGPAPAALLAEAARRKLPLAQTYGLTEACSQAVTLTPAEALRKPGSAGRPLAPVQLRVVSDSNRPTAPFEAGEILLKGPTITPGYADRPEATALALREGWFATGDIGYLDDDGYLFVLARRADLIISGGENIYPAEIESVLQTHPAVTEAGVCGQPDQQWGQVPIAFVVLQPGSQVSTQELQSYTGQRLAHFKQPHAIHFTARLPRTSSGKLLRRALAALAAHE